MRADKTPPEPAAGTPPVAEEGEKEGAGPEEKEQTAVDATDGGTVQPEEGAVSPETSLFELTERKLQEDIRSAKEAEELAEEEECRRIW